MKNNRKTQKTRKMKGGFVVEAKPLLTVSTLSKMKIIKRKPQTHTKKRRTKSKKAND